MTKKFEDWNNINESISKDDPILGRNVFTGGMDVINDNDIRLLKRDGRNIYYLSKKFELVEVKSAYNFKYNRERHDKIKSLFFITPEYAESIKPLVSNLKKLQELHEEKISTMLQMLVAGVQEYGSGNNETE